MIPLRPVIITAPANATSTTAKRTLFRVSLCVAMIGSVLVSTILFLQGGLALGHLRYFVDIGQHPLHITSTLVLFFGLLSILTFIILAVGLIKVNRTFAIIAAGLLAVCSLGLIAFSIWSFVTLTREQIPRSITNALIEELDKTQYNAAAGNNLIVDNTSKMARLEKQHQCCGLNDGVDDYRNRLPSGSGQTSSGTRGGRPSSSQKNPASVLLPISCCNEKYRSNDNNFCSDIYGNSTDPLSRYNIKGCALVITEEKIQRIKQQGYATIAAASLAVISCIAIAAVVRLLAEGYQVVPLRTAT